jgi:hypothetical protein
MSFNCDQNTIISNIIGEYIIPNFKMIKITYVESVIEYSDEEQEYVNTCEYFEGILQIVPNDYNNKGTKYNAHYLGKIKEAEVIRLKNLIKKQCRPDLDDSSTKWNVLEIIELN